MKMNDPSRLHLKKELTQIRKAARVLRDPGTTSSWKSTSRSTANPFINPNSLPTSSKHKHKHKDNNNNNNNTVFLYNWNNYNKSFNKQQDQEVEEEEDNNHSSSSLLASLEDSLSDANNADDAGFDSKSDVGTRSSFFRNSNPRTTIPPPLHNKKKQKQKQNNNNNNLNHHNKDDSGDDYSNSISGASSLLRKLNHNNNFLTRTSLKDDSSYSYSTPALSTTSFNRYTHRHRRYPSTVGSYDGTTTSVNDGDDEDIDDDRLDLPGRQGCGIPCYWSKRTTPKHSGSCCSPSFSDTLRRKGSSILCGTQSIYSRHYRRSSFSALQPHKRRMSSRNARCARGGGIVPLLTSTSSGDVRHCSSSIGIGRSRTDDDELSTNFGELDLEGLSRLDGRRWSSSCRSQEGLEIVPLNEDEEGSSSENSRSFSHKYKPLFFGELIGQTIVVHSLVNAVSRGRIAPVYLFQGPRGTGKTSTARIFAAALNCVASDEGKPCGYCGECADFVSGKSCDLVEVDGTNKKGIDKARYLLKRLAAGSSSAASSRYTVFVIDECHLLTSKTWLGFLKFLEAPPQRVVFIFITSDLDNVPRTIQSRCQKYLFNKIKDGDIVTRLRKISTQENLDVETDALDLIALNADGSLRDAETMLEQLSLLGKRITTSLVNELVGVVSDEKLLELLELAMSSDTAETVKRSRELMDSGVDPMVLMSQLAGLIMDIIAGSYAVVDTKPDGSFFGGRSLNETELERLKNALKLLSEAEKQLRTSSERSTWFTATLLQLGSVPSSDVTQSSSSRRQSCKTTEDDPSSASRDITSFKHKLDLQYMPQKSTPPASYQKSVNGSSRLQIDGFSLNSKPSNSPVIDDGSTVVSSDDLIAGNTMFRCIDSGKLCDIWSCCIERCHSKTLRQLLRDHGKLVSISEVQGVLVAYVAFGDGDIKLRVERFLSSITNSLEIVLRRIVEVRIILLPDGEGENQVNPSGLKQATSALASKDEQRRVHMNGAIAYSSLPQSAMGSSDIPTEGNGAKERRRDNPVQRIESIIREQRLETAWLQAVEKGSPGSLSRLRPEKNQVLPQDGVYGINPTESMDSTRFSSHQHREDDTNSDLKILALKNGRVLPKDQIGKRADSYPMSPSILHDSSLAILSGKDNLDCESGSGAGGCGFLCWNNKSKTRRAVKVKGTPVGGARRVGRFSLFGECGMPKKKESKR